MTDERYVARLRGDGFTEHEPIYLDELLFGSVATWDRVEKRWVTKDANGEYIAEPPKS